VQAPSERELLQLLEQNVVNPDGSITLITSGGAVDNLKKILFDAQNGQGELDLDEDDQELLSSWFFESEKQDVSDSVASSPMPSPPQYTVTPIIRDKTVAPPDVLVSESVSTQSVSNVMPTPEPIVDTSSLRRSSRQAALHHANVAIQRENMIQSGWFAQLHVDDDDGDDENEAHSLEAVITRRFQADQPTPINVAFKARKLHTEDNPTQGMIDKDVQLQLLWKEPARAEFAQFVIGKVMIEVDWKDIPKTRQIMQVRPIYKTKRKPNGEFDKLKCRMPIDGSVELRNGTFPDPQANYTPTLRQNTFILMFALAVLLGYKKFVVDITGCFLQNKLPPHREVFVQFPDSLTGGIKKYFKMLVAAYGLADASRIWFDKIIPLLQSIGFVQSAWDPCCLVLAEEGGRLIVGITTDDFFCIVTDTEVGKVLKRRMLDMLDVNFPGTASKSGYTMQDPMVSVIGYHVTVNDDGSETLTQPNTIDSIMKTFFPDGNLDDIPYESTQMPMTWDVDDLNNSTPYNTSDWLHALVVIIFLMRTRWDIVHAISKHSSRTHYCTEKDFEALKHLARYILHTKKMGITFHPDRWNEFKEKLQFIASADAAFLVHLQDSKSHISNNIKLASSMDNPSAMIQVTSQKESDAPSSSAVVAEAKAAFDVVKSIIVAEGLAEEITGLPVVRPTIIEEDSTGAIRACKDYSRQISSRKMSHETLKFRIVMHYINQGLIKFRQVKSEDQTSDAGTKQQRPTQHWKVLPTILGHSEAVFAGQDEAVRRRGSINAKELYSIIHRAYSAVDRSTDFADVLAQAAENNMHTARDPAIIVNENTRKNGAQCEEGQKLRDQGRLCKKARTQNG